MSTTLATENNFDDENLEFIEQKIKDDRLNKVGKRAYTMMQENSDCTVTINENSRKKCAKLLTK